jgi:peptidoglycan/xylan/chitin deacetylase (PgdA/CDA1 family)
MFSFRLDRFLALYFFHHVIRGKGPADDKKIPILMYHSISDDKESTTHPYYRVNTSPAVFAEHMRYFSENDYSVVDLQDLEKCFDTTDKSTKKIAVITFDDGYRDFYTNAFPILQEHRYPATVFLPTSFIDKKRYKFKGKECLSWGEVRELHYNGISIGSHSVSHPELYNLSWKMIHQELNGSRRRIEDELQAVINIFSYPYAFPQEDHDFVLHFKQELLENGYHAAVTTIIGRTGREHDPLILARLPVNQCDDDKLFEAKLFGDYDWMAGAQSFARSVKFHLRNARKDT